MRASVRRWGSPRPRYDSGCSALVDSGVMQIVAVTDPMQLGFDRQAMIGIRLTGDTTRWPRSWPRSTRSTMWCSTAGCFDAIIEVVCEDDDDLLELLNNQIRAFQA